MLIRPMGEDDLSLVLDIGRQSMASPWSLRQVAEELQFPKGLQLVAENDELCGYAFFRQVGPEVELLQLAVLPAVRRKGVATALVRRGLSRLCARQAEVCFLEVRKTDTAAQLFYEQAGFQRVGLRKKYYSGPLDDAVIMRKPVNKDRNDEDHS